MSETLPENFKDWNEQMILRYDPEIFHHHPRGVVRWVEGKRARAVISSLKASAEHRILDVGCGAGNILARLPGNQRFGLDTAGYSSVLLRAQRSEQVNKR